MRVGRHRSLVTVQKDTGTARGNQGSVTASWARHAKWWARIVPLAGTEPHEAGQKFSEQRYRFEGRYLPMTDDVGKTATDPKMRILWGTRTFDIVSVVDVDQRRRETHMVAVERTT